MATPVPQSNVEKYLSVIAGHSTETPSEPTSRAEYYLAEIVSQGGIGGKLKPRPVSELPATGESGILYLVPVRGTSGQNTHDEYIWIEEESKYELLGQAKIEIDLSDYALRTELPAKVSELENDSGYLSQHQNISGKVDKEPGKGLSTNDYTDGEKSKLSGIEAGANKTLIDASLSNAGQAADAKATGNAVSALKAENALLRELIQGLDAPVYRTASGSPVILSDGYAANVKTLSVTLAPVQSGSGDPSPDNVRPISGVSSVSVTRTGKNLYGGRSSVTLTVATFIVMNGAYRLPLKAGTDVTISFDWAASGDGADAFKARFYRADGSYNGTVTNDNAKNVENGKGVKTFHATADIVTFSLYMNGVGTASNIQIEYGDAATDYEAYQGQTVALSLVDSNSDPLTVYGGTLNVTTGELTVTWGLIPNYNGETLPGVWMSDRDVYSEGATPTAGAQVVYELAPADYQTYPLTAAQLATISGYNCVFIENGTLSVEYRADPTLSLGG